MVHVCGKDKGIQEGEACMEDLLGASPLLVCCFKGTKSSDGSIAMFIYDYGGPGPLEHK